METCRGGAWSVFLIVCICLALHISVSHVNSNVCCLAVALQHPSLTVLRVHCLVLQNLFVALRKT